jgi:3'-5' exoribonuclease
MKDFYISDAGKHENQKVTSWFCVAAKQVKPKKTGGPYLQLTLADRTGQIEAKMWDNVEETMSTFEQGDFVKAEGLVNRYNGRLQFTVHRMRKAEDGEAQAADFLPATTKDVEEMWSTLRGKVASFRNEDLKELLNAFLDDPSVAGRLRQAPAAKALHHAWMGGLLEHIVSLMELCDSVAPHYPNVNRDLLLTGVLLHDIGKLEELQYATAFGYSTEGQLLGHIAIGLRMIHERLVERPAFPAKLRTLVEHMVLSHHGRYEFGSPKLPMTPEAMMLHMLDDLDAKMQAMRSEFEKQQTAGNDGTKMTDWVRAMERPLLDTNAYLEDRKSGDEEADVEVEASMAGAPEAGALAKVAEVVVKTTVVEAVMVEPGSNEIETALGGLFKK